MDNQVYPLFACPLVICGEKYSFPEAEKQFLSDLEMVDNLGNLMSTDDRLLDSEALKSLRAFADQKLLAYKKELLRIRDEHEIYITQSWLNRSATNAFHPRHRHPNSIISGVLFLDDNSDRSLPPIRFHRGTDMFPLALGFEELTDFNADSMEFDPDEGMLILFPSLLEHEVSKNRSERTRSSLSFNTFVRGKIGGRSALTEVEIA